MRQFKDFNSAFKWTKEILNKVNAESIPTITEEVYKDSEKYTYQDTEVMYKSGQKYNEYDNGLIILRTPYVKRRYYEGGKAGSKNPRAIPMWFERTKKENKNKYIKQYKVVFDKVKRGGV